MKAVKLENGRWLGYSKVEQTLCEQITDEWIKLNLTDSSIAAASMVLRASLINDCRFEIASSDPLKTWFLRRHNIKETYMCVKTMIFHGRHVGVENYDKDDCEVWTTHSICKVVQLVIFYL